MIVLYTDGVTEALNSATEMYTEARVASRLAAIQAEPVQAVVEKILSDVQSFIAEAEQADDITLMALRFIGESSTVHSQEEL